MSNREVIKTKILSKKELVPNIYEMIVDADNQLNTAKAGQFIHISCEGDTFLRRPISICEIFDNKLRFIFEVRGKGTKLLAEKNEGDVIDLLGPLGNGFTVDKKYKNPVVIGGGIGIYPLLETAKQINATAILGFRTKELVTLEEDFKKHCNRVYITTDDGSYQRNGRVTDVLAELLLTEDIDAIFACGPMPMLKALKPIAANNGIYLEVSLEERMACGIGACLCCATKVSDKEMEEGYNFAHVCKHGPVFNAKEVLFND